MVTLNAHYDGKTIVPDEPLDLPPNQKLRITVEPIGSPPPATEKPKRQLGLQRSAVLYIAPDFDAELGDDFWLGEDK